VNTLSPPPPPPQEASALRIPALGRFGPLALALAALALVSMGLIAWSHLGWRAIQERSHAFDS